MMKDNQNSGYMCFLIVSSMIDVFLIVMYLAIPVLCSVPMTLIVIASLPIFAILSLIITPLFKASPDKKFETGLWFEDSNRWKFIHKVI